MMKIFYFCLFLAAAIPLCAQNPLVPPGVYLADPCGRVWDDGILYIYGSVDESPDYYCSWRYHVLSSADLRQWKLHENHFSSKGESDQVPYSDQLLFAPDCQQHDGRYYLYYCLPDREYPEGVAVSASPTGPFRQGTNIALGGYNQIDPAVFIDDDGQGYYIWGQFTAKMARLKPNMIEIDISTIKDSVLTEAAHFFHEGGFLTKRNGIYYFIYAHMGRADTPTCIGYATSTSALGPYTYGGVIIDNDHCDPGVWNNHGSIVKYKGKWYVLYHRSTHGCKTMRKACIEPIHFNADGTIDEVEMTSQGVGGPLPARSYIDAERACLLYGNVRIQAIAADTEALAGIKNGDRAAFKYLDFGEGVESISMCIKSGAGAGRIEVVIDRPWNAPSGTVDIPPGAEEGKWALYRAALKDIRGVHCLWLRFYGEGEGLFEIDWLTFADN